MHQRTKSTIVQGMFQQLVSIYQCFCQIRTAHAQRLLFRSFLAIFWHLRWRRRPRFPIMTRIFWWWYNIYVTLTFDPCLWSCVTCWAPQWPGNGKSI